MTNEKRSGEETPEEQRLREMASLDTATGGQGPTTAGLGGGEGYDVVGNLGSAEQASRPPPTGDHETSSHNAGTDRGSGGGGPGSVGQGLGGGSSGGGTGGMTGVGGAGTRNSGIGGGSSSGAGHPNEISPVAGGVAVSAGRGSDVGDPDHGLGGERGGLSGGSFGGSAEQEVGGGLSGGMRSAQGSDASGGMGQTRGNQPIDPAEGGADVSTDQNPGGISERSG